MACFLQLVRRTKYPKDTTQHGQGYNTTIHDKDRSGHDMLAAVFITTLENMFQNPLSPSCCIIALLQFKLLHTGLQVLQQLPPWAVRETEQ